MLEHAAATQPLNEVQLMLLRLFSRPVSTQDLDAIQNILRRRMRLQHTIFRYNPKIG